MSDHQHRIVCAANRHKDGRIVLGVRHFCPAMIAAIKAYLDWESDEWRGSEQGFVSNDWLADGDVNGPGYFWKFLTREEAWKVADAAGQIIKDRDWFTGFLHSEHLY